MGFKCGIVGLPNVGKSTLFNALTQTAAAQAANYPFCTIEPNVGDVAVPDPRLEKLAAIAKSAEIIPTRITFVDIAGLVRGASKGEGLGNQFLANIREVDAVVHVLRCFEGDVVHVENRVDPVADAETVETELMLADLDSLERRIVPIEKRAKTADKEAKEQFALMSKALDLLRAGKPARRAELTPEEREPYRQLGLLTQKPVLYVCNVDEASAAGGNSQSARVIEMAKREHAGAVVISARIEEEVAQLAPAERDEYLASLGLDEPGLNRLIHAGLRSSRPDHVLHRGAERGPRVDGDQGLARARRPRAPSTPISSTGLSAPKPSPMTITWRTAARPARAMPASSASKARITSSRTAT